MEEENKLPFERLKEHLREINTPTGISYSGDKTISKENAEWLINLIEEQQKVIDMIAEYLVSCDFDEMCGELEQPCMMRWNCKEDIEMRADCIKQYYFKKVRGEKNE